MEGDKIMSEVIVEAAEKVSSEMENIPMLEDWTAPEDDIYFEFKDEYVQARFSRYGLNKDNKLGLYIIKKSHFQDRMPEICNTINYFLTFFDEEKELFKNLMQVKFIIDQRPRMTIEAFQNFLIKNVITDSFVSKIKKMTDYLYRINIDSDTEGKYKNTPKISNAQAKQIVAISFAIRCVFPTCIHFSDTNLNFLHKKDYIPCFDKIIVRIIKRFEKNDVKVFSAIEKFTEYRVARSWKADIGVCIKKKQLYGMTVETYLEEVIHEIILVKSLYKLTYNRSVVSFIDGVIFKYHGKFIIENFKTKPIEIDPQENTNDDEKLSHAEAIEMAAYRVDESIPLISDANTKQVLKQIRRTLSKGTTSKEIKFYEENMSINPITKMILEAFYSRIFHDPNAVLSLDRPVIIELIVYMKHYLQLKGMVLLPQICTAKIRGKYRENAIKNAKFREKLHTSDVWMTVINDKFKYLAESGEKDNPLEVDFSIFVDSQFEVVDYKGPDNGKLYEDIDQDLIIYEFSNFLSII